MTLPAGLRAARLSRRLASGLYEALIVLALVFMATLPFSYLFGDATQGWRRHLLQAWVLAVLAAYFTWFWTHGGQTLPMQTWKLRVVAADGQRIYLKQAVARYLFAVIGFFLLGCGILWALFDRDGLFLHDRLAGTKIVRMEG